MLKIALISENTAFLDEGKHILTKKGYETRLFSPLHENLIESLIELKPDLIILDFTSSPKTSQSLIKEVNKNSSELGSYCIAILDERIADNFDFKLGVDDFIFKKSFTKEIELRVELFQWKCHKIDSKDKIIISDFVIDNANYEVIFMGKKVDLTYKEFELLKFLVTHKGRVYSRDALLNQVWGYNYYGGTRTVDVHVRRLRAKIGFGIDDYLKTIRNVGYKFEG